MTNDHDPKGAPLLQQNVAQHKHSPMRVGDSAKSASPPVTPVPSSRRPVQLSAFPDVRPERPWGPLPVSVVAGTNADLLAAVGPLYCQGPTLDVTYGRGAWWRRFRPDVLSTHDLAADGVDFRDLPEADASYETVCFDPPYVPAGGRTTSSRADFRDRFGLDQRSESELTDLVVDGMAECARVTRRFVLAKCADYVTSGRFVLGHVNMLAAGYVSGLVPWDLVIHAGGSGPGGHNIRTPLRCRRAHSYLLIFAKG